MKKTLLMTICSLFAMVSIYAQTERTLLSPDGQTWLTFHYQDGRPSYSAGRMENQEPIVLLKESPLGLLTNIADFSTNLTLTSEEEFTAHDSYSLRNSKTSQIDYEAKGLLVTLATSTGKTFSIRFQISNNNIAFRYEIPTQGVTTCCVIKEEATGYAFPEQTTTFLCPQSSAMVGWMRSKPSYEEEYKADAAMTETSRYGEGFTFPCLFHIGDDGWILLSETGVDGNYCGSHISDYQNGQYTIAFPMEGENNGFGSTGAQMALPGQTPWRTITLGQDLEPIVETTIPFDVVKPLYEPSIDYQPGKSTWSWIIWQDASMNYNDQKTFIDLSHQLGWQYILIDALWESQVGREKLTELIHYAATQNVNVFLWYNSNGGWNDAPQDVKQCMSNPIVRKKEMKWLQSLGVKGIKVDFFAGDKQETLKLYEAILSDANEYGIQVIFHGCTLPRGWERMYPNYCSSEAVLASENLVFTQRASDKLAFNTSLHPFIRNAVGSMDFGGTFLQKRLNRNNDGGSIRRTTDIFEMATAILFQSSVQNFGLTPINLVEQPAFEIDFMRNVPTVWDEIKYIDGYPGKYIILARRHGKQWYIAGVNAESETQKITLDLTWLSGQTLQYYNDGSDGLTPNVKQLKVNNKGKATVEMVPNGGFILCSGETIP